MQQLEEIMNQYLEMDTNYALMITGNWGIGKTYYFKNHLSNKIKDIELHSDSSKKYKTVLISLFGLNSIEEIQSEIFLSLYPILKDKKLKLSASIGKAIAKGILHFKGFGEYSKFIDDTDLKKKDLINLEEIVLCFDDLERLSDNLNLEELIGYINSLVENGNAKVIIIANEDKIENIKYNVLKEKVVGNTIEFLPDINETFDNLIKAKFSGFKVYKSFLKDKKEYILNLFTQHSNNLRTLSFSLQYFHKIFSNFELEISKHKILGEKKDEILEKLLKFSLVISIEYKKGEITFNKRQDLNQNSMSYLDQIRLENFIGKKNDETIDETKKSYKDKFLEKYYSDECFVFWESIYSYITGGYSLNINNLFLELNDFFNIKDEIIEPQYILYRKLSYPNVFELDDEQYLNNTKEILEFAEKGVFNIIDYLTVFYFVSRFENPLNIKLEELKTRIIAGIDKGIDSYQYNYDLDFYMNVSEKSENKDYLIKIREHILKINENILSKSKSSDYKRLEKLCYEDFNSFFNELSTREKDYYYSPILKIFNPQEFFKFYLDSRNAQKWTVLKFFKSRYKNTMLNYIQDEKKFLEELSKILDQYLTKNKVKSLSLNITKDLKKTIDENIKKL